MNDEGAVLISEGTTLSRRYRLDEFLGEGALIRSFKAHDLILDRPVIVKVLNREMAHDGLTESFRSEAISAARLSHPNIVPTFDAGTDEGTAFVVTGYVDGFVLSDVLEKDGTLPLEVALTIGTQVTDALDHAHSAGLVHRDVRPSRLLVVDEDYRVMLTDFGIATAVAETADENLHIEGVELGDPAYLSPEQNVDHRADARSDIYATGRLLHTIACGKEHALDECDKVPPAIIAILSRATAADADERYQNAAEMKSDLDHYLGALTKTNGPPTVRRVLIAPPLPPRIPSASAPQPDVHHEDDDSATQAVPEVRWASTDDTAQHQPVTVHAPAAQPAPAATPTVERVRLEGENRGRRRKLVTMAVVAIFVVGAIALGRLVASVLPDGSEQATPATTAPPAVTTAASFDPFGDGRENEGQVGAIVDNDPATSWTTERYNTRRFGNLKPGLGVVLTASQAATFRSLQVDTGSTGWSAQVYVADAPKGDLVSWGQPVDTQSGLGATANFDLHSAQGSAVLLWITDLGSSNRLSISGAQLSS